MNDVRAKNGQSKNLYAIYFNLRTFKPCQKHGTHQQIWMMQPIRLSTFRNFSTEGVLALSPSYMRVAFQSRLTYAIRGDLSGRGKKSTNGYFHKMEKLLSSKTIHLPRTPTLLGEEGLILTWSDNGF